MKISVLALDGVFDTGLSAVLDVFDAANQARLLIPEPPPEWQVTTVGLRRTVRTRAGHRVAAVPPGEPADLLIVPALGGRDPELLLAEVAGTGLRRAREAVAGAAGAVAAACTGTLVLAEAGVLDGRQATTSWWLAPAFRKRYGKVDLVDTRMLVHDGGITTAGAAFAHVDLALDLVRGRSPATAELVARFLLLDDRPSQAPYAIPSVLARTDPLVSAFEHWIRDRMAEPLVIGDAAAALNVSERTLQRAVQKALGRSPVHFVQDIRVEHATHLLRTTDLSFQAVANRVGYVNAGTLRALLNRRKRP